jgi:hypothetical protein
MMFWANLLGYQLVWFLLVRGAANASLALPLVAGAAFVLAQLALAAQPRRELRLIAVAVLLGLAIDGVAAGTGLLRYASPSPALPPQGAPMWILMLWACFATTINRSLAVLQRRTWLAALLGGIGAPLAYAAAAGGWHAVGWTSWWGPAWIAVCWTLALPLLVVVNRRAQRQGRVRSI